MASFRTRASASSLLVVLAWLCPGSAVRLAGQAPAQDRPNFVVQVNLVTTDVVPRDANGNFVADLTRDDFEVYEDGVRQDIVSLTLSHGGRVTNVLLPQAPPAIEGLILPNVRPASEEAGRIFVFFVDDLHLQYQNTPRIRALFQKMTTILIHDGDMFGVVSSGPSSISMQLSYDRRRLEEAVTKINGDELKPSEIINGPTGQDGPSEVRYRARAAMSTVSQLLENLEKVHNRRKALVYISDGYDLIPFQDSRTGAMTPNSPFLQNNLQQAMNLLNAPDPSTSGNSSTSDPYPAASEQKQKEEFSDADLGIELAILTRAANRANTVIYTIDPRGLVGTPDLDEPVEPRQWSAHIAKSQDSLRELAEDTGGVAVVNQNDFDKALKRIDAETSDYYVLGYYSTNPDPTRRLRRVEVRSVRSGLTVVSQKEYLIRSLNKASVP